jgi:4-methyl-5(b-hydroxyethyl)-thiazole monophosphate biosynthesis
MSKVLVLLSPGFEEIEAVTIIDILRRGEIKVVIAGLEKEDVTGSHNISIKSDIYYKNVNIDDFDFLVLPGGQPGTNNLKANPTIIEWIQKFNKDKKIIGAICAAPTVLKNANIIKNVKITSYPSEKDNFDNEFYSEKNIVMDKNIITSRGVGTSIEFALELVNIINGKNVRDDLATKILWKQ